MKLTLKYHFDSAHKLPNYQGKCANLHGHRWNVEIEIVSQPNPATGMIIDFTKLKRIIDQYDHKYLNDFVENPTAEAISTELLMQIQEVMIKDHPFLSTVTIRLWESPDAMIEVSTND